MTPEPRPRPSSPSAGVARARLAAAVAEWTSTGAATAGAGARPPRAALTAAEDRPDGAGPLSWVRPWLLGAVLAGAMGLAIQAQQIYMEGVFEDGIVVTGEVVEKGVSNTDDCFRATHWQRVRFSTEQDQSVVERTYSCGTRPERPGDVVEVRYLPSDPSDLRFASGPGSSNGTFGPRWISIAIMALAGAALVRILVGLGLHLARRPAPAPASVPEWQMEVDSTPGWSPIATRGTERMATTSLIVGVAALPLFPIGVVGVAAVAFGSIALSRINRLGRRGRGRAVAGLVLGTLSLMTFAVLLLGLTMGDEEAFAFHALVAS